MVIFCVIQMTYEFVYSETVLHATTRNPAKQASKRALFVYRNTQDINEHSRVCIYAMARQF